MVYAGPLGLALFSACLFLNRKSQNYYLHAMKVPTFTCCTTVEYGYTKVLALYTSSPRIIRGTQKYTRYTSYINTSIV